MRVSDSKIEAFTKYIDMDLTKVQTGAYWVRQDSAIVQIKVIENNGKEYVDFVSIVVENTRVDEALLRKLLEMNLAIPFGAFAIEGDNVILRHCILGGEHMDIDEFTEALVTIAFWADEYDDKIIETNGGKTGLTVLKEILYEKRGKDFHKW